eukprot:364245-Chlamydomonas_euryale.AAC.5
MVRRSLGQFHGRRALRQLHRERSLGQLNGVGPGGGSIERQTAKPHPCKLPCWQMCKHTGRLVLEPGSRSLEMHATQRTAKCVDACGRPHISCRR